MNLSTEWEVRHEVDANRILDRLRSEGALDEIGMILDGKGELGEPMDVDELIAAMRAKYPA
jgi:hypothetical protein